MPTYTFVVYESRNFADADECMDELFALHADKLRQGFGYWAGQGTVPGTYMYKLEERKSVFGPERPPKKN